VIDGIRAHRISRYTSTDKKSVLKVSEIMELDIHSISVPDTDIVAFKAIQVSDYISWLRDPQVVRQYLDLEALDFLFPHQVSQLMIHRPHPSRNGSFGFY
jgi:hypothetical protein